jgi:hypothetical protein
MVGVLKDLLFGRASGSGLLLGLLPAPILHFSLVESHERHAAENPSTAHSSVSISVTLPSIAMRGAIALANLLYEKGALRRDEVAARMDTIRKRLSK